MAFEIERKFLIGNSAWKENALSPARIRQAYLASHDRASIRVRIRDAGSATLTIKSRGADLRRLELEYEIPTLEAEALMPLRRGCVIEKDRYLVPWRGATWEVDVFCHDNAGLVIAEIELQNEQQPVELPPWVAAEVTGQPQYYNSALARWPFCRWTRTGREAAL